MLLRWERTQRTRGEHPKNSREHRAAHSKEQGRDNRSTKGRVLPGIHSQGLVVSLRTPGVTLLVSLMIGDSILNSDAVLGLSVG